MPGNPLANWNGTLLAKTGVCPSQIASSPGLLFPLYFIFFNKTPHILLHQLLSHILSPKQQHRTLLFFFSMITTTTNFQPQPLLRPTSVDNPTTTIKFLSSSSSITTNLFLDWREFEIPKSPPSLLLSSHHWPHLDKQSW